MLAAVLQLAVAEHGAGKQTCLEQNLKAVADADHRTAAIGERFYLAHNRREARHGAGAKVVAMRKPSREDNDVRVSQARVFVPDELRRLPQYRRGGMIGIVIAVAA